jgi:hypothetical protein
MNMRRFVQILRCLCLLSAFASASVQAAPVRVLVVVGRGVSDDAQSAIESAVNAEAELVDSGEYLRMARSAGELPTSEAALERVAPRLQAQLIIVASKAGAKLVLVYRDGASGDILHKDSVPDRHRGAAAARFHSKVTDSVHKALSKVAAPSGSAAPARRAPAQEPVQEPIQEPEPEPEPDSPPADSAEEPSTESFESEPQREEPAAPSSFVFELSAGLGGATRQSDLPTRLGVNQFDSGLHAGASLGLRLATALGEQGVLRASVDYRTSLGLQGKENQRATEMSTSLRSHAVGFGIAPGYRFGAAAESISLLLHLGWYFRGLRPIAQLALPEMSWHAAVVRPELIIPLGGTITLRLAPELLVIAGMETTLPDQSGLSRTGFGFGAEASVDIRLGAPVGLRIDYRESHASFATAWANSVSDVERFAAVRVLLLY